MSWAAKTEEKRRFEKRFSKMRNRYCGSGVYRLENGRWIRWYPYSISHGNNKKWWRRYGNRRYRRGDKDILNRGLYKRNFDLWWAIT